MAMILKVDKLSARPYTDYPVGVWVVDDMGAGFWLGYLPEWVTANPEVSIVDEIHNNYAHGGGWHDFEGFTVDPDTGAMSYPGDPVQMPIALFRSDTEVMWLYSGSWVTVYDDYSETFRTARID